MVSRESREARLDDDCEYEAVIWDREMALREIRSWKCSGHFTLSGLKILNPRWAARKY